MGPRRDLRRGKPTRAGFSLVEVVVALGLLTVLVLFMAAAAASSANLNEMMQERRVATAQAQAVLNTILATQELQSDSNFVDPVSGTPKTLDFTDFGETAPPELADWSTSVTIRSYQARLRVASSDTARSSTTAGTDPVITTNWFALANHPVGEVVVWGPYPDGDPGTAGFQNATPPVDWSSNDFNPAEYDTWNDGNMFEVEVAVRWTPAAWKRSGQTGTYQGVTLRSLYYPSPPAN
ncbi:MAG: hypothetical protein D6731_05195 [Planctomycetota bacterium]|nr:MAG: hypothetical protein D6731_05195 [Planctomycetota bacterium]